MPNNILELMILSDERYHGLDALRSVAMILGIVLHASLPFFDTKGLWPSDEYESPLIMSVFSLIHLWRMPLFFLLSGFFTFVVIKKRGRLYWCKQRILRLGIPLVIFVPILALVMPLIWHYGENGSFAGVDIQTWEASPHHLWFLIHLILFIPMLGIGWFFAWIFNFLPTNKSLGLSSLATRVIYSRIPIAIMFLFIPILLPTGGELIVNPLGSFLFFLFGYGLANRRVFLEYLSMNWAKYMMVAFLCFLMHEYWAHSHISQYEPKYLQNEEGLNGVLNLLWYSSLKPVNTILFSYALIGLFLSKFNIFNYKWRYLSDGSYWMYIVHLPVVTMFSFYLFKFSVPIELKFAVSIMVTLIFSLFTYKYLVRSTFIGFLLNGKRQ